MSAMMNWKRWLLLVPVLLVTLALLAAACGGGDDKAASGEPDEESGGELFMDPSAPVVDVSLSEWSVALDSASGEAGSVTFSADNEGKTAHEVVIIKTDTPADKLAVTNGKIDEDTAGEFIGEIEEFEAGDTVAGTFDLAPGNYVLLCNIEGHYASGMHTGFSVE